MPPNRQLPVVIVSLGIVAVFLALEFGLAIVLSVTHALEAVSWLLLGWWALGLAPILFTIIALIEYIAELWLALRLFRRFVLVGPKLDLWVSIVGWYVVITGGWLLARDVFFTTIDGLKIARNYDAEIFGLLLSTVIFATASLILVFGWSRIGNKINAPIRQVWRRFYATWLS